MGEGHSPTWQYVLPVFGLGWFLLGEPGLVRDLWLWLGGGSSTLLLAWHLGWRKSNTEEKS